MPKYAVVSKPNRQKTSVMQHMTQKTVKTHENGL